jgi:S1/P1 Nuclease
MNSIQTVLTAACLIIANCPAAHAWDNVGHMAVAGLAYDELPPAKQQQLDAILRQHPKVNFIIEGFPDANIEDRDFVMAAATWPDLARAKTSERTPQSDRMNDPGYEEDKPAVQKIDANDWGILHRGWHFIDKPLWVGTSAAPSKLPPEPAVNAVNVVNVLIKQLKSNEDEKEKAFELAWLMHLVGDLHQPLHAVDGISETLPGGDHGGNWVKVESENQGAYELHAFWDDILGKSATEDKRTHLPHLEKDVANANEVIAEVEGVQLPKNANNVDPSVWAAGAFRLAKRDAYNLHLVPYPVERPSKNEPAEILEATLDQEYGTNAKRDAEKQVHLAGHRLALILKDVLH